MREFSPEQIESARKNFAAGGFPLRNVQLDGRTFSYYVMPQEVFGVLEDFAFRMTHTEPQNGLVSGIFGVCDSVPEELRDYWAAHEYIEFVEIGIAEKRRCLRAEKSVLDLIPEGLCQQFITRRISFFENLVAFFRNEIANSTGNYHEADLREARATLRYLRRHREV